MVHPVDGPSPDPDHLIIFDRDVACAPVAAEYTGGLHPPVDICLEHPIGEFLIHPDRPMLASPERGPFTPNISNPVGHYVTLPFRCAGAHERTPTYSLSDGIATSRVDRSSSSAHLRGYQW